MFPHRDDVAHLGSAIRSLAGGGGVMSTAGRRPSVHQTSYALLCQRLRGLLVNAVRAGPRAAGGVGSVPCRASATLYMLLVGHPVDRRGRCRSCWGPGAVLGLRRRFCRVRIAADYWLHQRPEFLHSSLARELELTDLVPAGDLDRAGTLPRMEPVSPPTAPR